jgi:GPH family glycoside/pentoside/hexuronide:cation symporter
MVFLGYVEENQGNQTMEVATNMRYLVAGLYLVAAIFMFVGLGLIYNLNKKTTQKMSAELAERRAA